MKHPDQRLEPQLLTVVTVKKVHADQRSSLRILR